MDDNAPRDDERAHWDKVSATDPDWSRERRRRLWDPGPALIAAIRDYQAQSGRRSPVARLRRRIAVLRHLFWTTVTQCEIPLNGRFGGGLLLPHPNGILIHPKAELGPNCLVFQQVTIGFGSRPGAPRLGGHVDVGAGAKILGGVTVGDHARIGANAVVVDDVPPRTTAVGVPARVITRPVAGTASG